MQYYIYILATENNKVIYTGVTNNLARRVEEHKSGAIKGFTQRYNVHKLVYFETFTDVTEAILREKQIKKWSRSKKNALIEKVNAQWKEVTVDGYFE